MKPFLVDAQALLCVAVALLDADGLLLEANAGFLRLLPQDGADLVGTRISRYFVQPAFGVLLEAMARTGADGYRGLLNIGTATGKVRSLRGRLWRSERGIQLLAEYDITDLERLDGAIIALSHDSGSDANSLARANAVLRQRERQVVETSLTDALTGVGNRRKLEQALVAELSRVQRSGTPLSLIIADIDHFKQVNDQFGHGIGDKVLREFAVLLQAQSRPTDLVARFGGEEFVVLMPDTALRPAQAKAEKLRLAIAALVIEPLMRALTASFGVAELLPGETAESLIGRADIALYEAKRGGRNCVLIATATHGKQAMEGPA